MKQMILITGSYLQKTLDSRKFVKETKFVSKDDAAKDFEKEVGVFIHLTHPQAKTAEPAGPPT